MRVALLTMLVISVFGLMGCETLNVGNTDKKNASKTTMVTSKSLTPQDLASGECGLFLWTESAPRTFVFFQKQGSQSAKYYTQDTEISLQTSENTSHIADNDLVSITYSGGGFASVKLKGLLTQNLQDGRRVSDATLKTKKADAWEEIQPVSGVYVCR